MRVANRSSARSPTTAWHGTPAWRARTAISPSTAAAQRAVVEAPGPDDDGARGAHPGVEAERLEDEARARLAHHAARQRRRLAAGAGEHDQRGAAGRRLERVRVAAVGRREHDDRRPGVRRGGEPRGGRRGVVARLDQRRPAALHEREAVAGLAAKGREAGPRSSPRRRS